jgi:hypothetical protein
MMYTCCQNLSQRCSGTHTTYGGEGAIENGPAVMGLVELEEWGS